MPSGLGAWACAVVSNATALNTKAQHVLRLLCMGRLLRPPMPPRPGQPAAAQALAVSLQTGVAVGLVEIAEAYVARGREFGDGDPGNRSGRPRNSVRDGWRLG